MRNTSCKLLLSDGVAGARNVYERWMEWNPSDKGWMLYVHFEERCKELGRARKVFEKYVGVLHKKLSLARGLTHPKHPALSRRSEGGGLGNSAAAVKL